MTGCPCSLGMGGRGGLGTVGSGGLGLGYMGLCSGATLPAHLWGIGVEWYTAALLFGGGGLRGLVVHGPWV